MALINCPECGKEISDKSISCIHCGFPLSKTGNIVKKEFVHQWRCPKCGNMISEEPCPYCSNAQTAVNINSAAYESSVSATPAFVAKDKRNLRILVTCLVIAAIAIIVFTVASHNSGSSNKALDPNRTQESCDFLGTADVYPALHNNGNCHRDGDGYYWPGFGHHHHK